MPGKPGEDKVEAIISVLSSTLPTFEETLTEIEGEIDSLDERLLANLPDRLEELRANVNVIESRVTTELDDRLADVEGGIAAATVGITDDIAARLAPIESGLEDVIETLPAEQRETLRDYNAIVPFAPELPPFTTLPESFVSPESFAPSIDTTVKPTEEFTVPITETTSGVGSGMVGSEFDGEEFNWVSAFTTEDGSPNLEVIKSRTKPLVLNGEIYGPYEKESDCDKVKECIQKMLRLDKGSIASSIPSCPTNQPIFLTVNCISAVSDQSYRQATEERKEIGTSVREVGLVEDETGEVYDLDSMQQALSRGTTDDYELVRDFLGIEEPIPFDKEGFLAELNRKGSPDNTYKTETENLDEYR